MYASRFDFRRNFQKVQLLLEGMIVSLQTIERDYQNI